MSTYSDNLRIELITTGTQAGTWGTTTNTNLGTIIEDSIAGYAAVAVSSANQAFTAVNGAADQARCAIIELTTSTGSTFAVYAPPVTKEYIIWNNSSYTATIYNSTVLGNTTAAGTGVAIPAGDKVTVFSDGTNFYQAGASGTVKSVALSGGTTGLTVSGSPITSSGTITLAGTLAVANGGTGATTAATARTNLGATTVGSNMFTLTNPSAVTFLQVNADNTVSALDAASFRTAIGAGSGGGSVTSVALSGGTTGLTVSGSPITTSGTMTLAGTLAIANGGTGATTASGARTALDVPSTSGSGATGTWGINISGSAASASTASTATTATTATNVTNALGSGQSWQNVGSSRTNNTTYTNSTGKPIMVTITFTAVNSYGYLVVDGVTVGGATNSGGTFPNSVSAVVPNGSSYSCSGSYDPDYWAELR